MRLTIYAILAIIAATAHGQTPYLDLVGEADKALGQNLWQDAETIILDALDTEPSNPSNFLLLSNLGMARFNLGKDSLALEALDKAHELAPGSTVVLANRAKVLQTVGRTDDAYRDYSEIITIDSTLTEPRFMHAMLAVMRRDYLAAEDDVKVLDRLSPDGIEAPTARASLFQHTAQYDKAVSQYDILIERKPSAAYHGGRAACLLMLKRYGEAADDIAAGLRLDPDDGDLYLYRAYLHKLRYQSRDADNDLRQALRLGVDPVRAQLLMGHNPQ
ncbi:MAG: tetratricopeptide repeat protein [Pseudoflavonifractor sp.]|nr:tetratricopeptide repeat protein [Pseudoflavonifractor sp.]